MGAGTTADPNIQAGITIKYTGTLYQYFGNSYLSDFTLTEVDGTFVSKSNSDVIAQINIVGSIGSPPATGHNQGSYSPVLLTTATGVGSGAEATININSLGTITQVIITDGGNNYAVGNQLTIPSAAGAWGTIGGSDETITLTVGDMVPDFTKQVCNLQQMWIKAEDSEDTVSGQLRLKVYNTLNYRIFYKSSIIVRQWNQL